MVALAELGTRRSSRRRPDGNHVRSDRNLATPGAVERGGCGTTERPPTDGMITRPRLFEPRLLICYAENGLGFRRRIVNCIECWSDDRQRQNVAIF